MDILLSLNIANIGLVICASDSKVQRTWCFEKLVELLGGDGDQLLVGQANVVVVRDKLADVPVLVGRGLHVHLEKYKISLFSLSAAAVFWRLQQGYCSVLCGGDCSLVCSKCTALCSLAAAQARPGTAALSATCCADQIVLSKSSLSNLDKQKIS